MNKWIVAIIALPLLWAGYWFFGSYGLKAGIDEWLTDRRADGWQVEYSDLGVRGFPNRFDATVTDLQLTDPDGGISWSAPFFQMLSLSYKPNHWIAVWPESHSFSTPYQNIAISSTDTKASVVVGPDTLLPLQRGTVVIQNAVLTSSQNWDIEVDQVSASIRELDLPNQYGIAMEVNSLTPSVSLRNWLDEKQNLPSKIENIAIDFTTRLTAPIDRKMIDTARPQVVELSITQAKATWGEMLFRATGDITVNERGQMSGELQISAKNWREMLQVAVSTGAIPAEMAGAAEFGLGLIARLNGSDKTLDAPLSLSNGKMSLGPIPLGTAPNLIIR